LQTTDGIATIGSGDDGRGGRRPGRDFLIASCACLLGAASALHVAVYPRTFNSRPPAAVLAAPETGPAMEAPAAEASAAQVSAAGDAIPGSRLVLVVVDGLRDDAAGGLDLERSPARDGALPPLARCTLRASWPTFSIPGYVTIATGAPPAISGVHNNWFSGPVELDSVFARARAAGRSTQAIGDETDDWGRLFPAELGGQETGVRAFARTTRRLFTDGAPAPDVLLIHTVVVDEASHAAGALSAPTARAIEATGSWLRSAIGRMDPARDTLVVTSDHGHIDRGGHGGTEASVVRVPLFLIGRGVRRGTAPDLCEGRSLSDLAPTLAVLAGVQPPRHAVGTVLRPLLSFDSPVLDAVDAAGRRFRAALAAALGGAYVEAALAESGPGRPAPWTGLVGLAAAVGLGWLLLLLAGRPSDSQVATGGRPSGRAAGWLRCCAVASVYPLLAWSIALLLEPGATFSAKRADWHEYAVRMFLLLSGAAVVAFGVHLLAFVRAPRDQVRRARAVAVAGAAASWPIVVGLHGSPFGAPLGEPHLSFAVVLSGLVACIGCGYLTLILALDAILARVGARRAAPAGVEGCATVTETHSQTSESN
jgi:Metalloenzyme superfamily